MSLPFALLHLPTVSHERREDGFLISLLKNIVCYFKSSPILFTRTYKFIESVEFPDNHFNSLFPPHVSHL